MCRWTWHTCAVTGQLAYQHCLSMLLIGISEFKANTLRKGGNAYVFGQVIWELCRSPSCFMKWGTGMILYCVLELRRIYFWFTFKWMTTNPQRDTRAPCPKLSRVLSVLESHRRTENWNLVICAGLRLLWWQIRNMTLVPAMVSYL